MERKSEAERARLRERLERWQKKVERDETAWAKIREAMDGREALYDGDKSMEPVTKAEEKQKGNLKCYHVRNVIQENIETMIDSHIPAPKVIPLKRENEALARELEHLLRFCVMRWHLRVKNEMAERINYVQGGVGYLVEWDNTKKTPDGTGDVVITLLHPKQLVPQEGIFTDVEDMDHVTVKLAKSRQEILRRFGVDVDSRAETDSGIRGRDEETGTATDMVTLYMTFYRNDEGEIGMFAWANDTVVADYEDYQARRVRRCRSCGTVDSYLDARPEDESETEELRSTGELKKRVHRCSVCEGTEFEDAVVDAEEILLPQTILTTGGKEIELQPANAWMDRKTGKLRVQARSFLPYYKPDMLPVVLQKNVVRFGQLLGESDVDRMKDAQNLVKRMDKKMIDRMTKAGTKLTMPSDTHYQPELEDQEVIRIKNQADMNMFRTLDFAGDVSQELTISARAYEEAREATGVTDSMQGRRDPTATSARAKEFAANQSEGRMQSKRVMKKEAWAKLYELIAKLFLANADEKMHLRVPQPGEEMAYETFSRKDFLQLDTDGTIRYETGFIFDCDDAVLLGDSREAMWRELKESFNGGTLGDPTDIETRILYWGLLDEQGYPGASAIKKKMEEQRQRMQEAQKTMPPQTEPQAAPGGQIPAGRFFGASASE